MTPQQQSIPPSHLLQAWNALQTTQEEYMQDQEIVKWVQAVFEKKAMVVSQKQVQQKMKIYIQEVHGLDYDTVTNLGFKYDEACDFYKWLTEKADQQHQQIDQNHSQKYQQPQQDREEQGEEPEPEQGQQKEEKIEQEQEQRESEKSGEVFSQQKQNAQNNDEQKKSLIELIQNQFEQPTKVEQVGVSTGPKICKSHEEFLSSIFEHYCRISYATGNDPTFDHIHQKSQVMTINKFMIFCKDFGILGGKSVSRPVLVELFKKNAKFYKEMNEEQFIDSLKKIADLFFSDNQEQQSKKYERLLVFMQVDSVANFKKKSSSLGIVLKPKVTNVQQVPHRSIRLAKAKLNQSENVNLDIQSIKKIGSQSKIKQQAYLPRNPSNKRSQQPKQPHSNSLQVINQQKQPLPPAIPPARKISQSAPRKPIVSSKAGYANIYHLKQSGRGSSLETKLKLNSVVQQAKKMIYFEKDTGINLISEYGPETKYSQYLNNIQMKKHSFSSQTESEQVNSKQQISPKNKNVKHYESYAHSRLLQSKNANENTNRGLYDIIGNDSDEDEYLQEHLNREKSNNAVGERIQKKIRELQQKMDLE